MSSWMSLLSESCPSPSSSVYHPSKILDKSRRFRYHRIIQINRIYCMTIYFTIKKTGTISPWAFHSSDFFLLLQLIKSGPRAAIMDLEVVSSGPSNSDINQKTWEVVVFLGFSFVVFFFLKSARRYSRNKREASTFHLQSILCSLLLSIFRRPDCLG